MDPNQNNQPTATQTPPQPAPTAAPPAQPTPTPPAADQPPATPAAGQPAAAAPAKGGKSKMLWIVLAVVVVLAIVAYFLTK